jgi:hypothetical protein
MADVHDPYKPPSAPIDGPRAGDGGGARVPDRVLALLAETRPWVKLVAALFFVVVGLMIVFFVAAAALAPTAPGAGAALPWTLMPSGIVILLYVPGVLYLWRYAVALGQLEAGGGTDALEVALSHQKSFWKYVGILAIVFASLCALAVVVGYVVGRMTHH